MSVRGSSQNLATYIIKKIFFLEITYEKLIFYKKLGCVNDSNFLNLRFITAHNLENICVLLKML